jgi:phenylacetate-CoA ligase
MLADDPERELWDPRAQAIEPLELDRLIADGLAREWERVWQLPLPFYREHYERAGLRVDDVPALDEIPRTTKANLREDETDFPPFGRHRAVGLDRAVRLGVTTGTTGKPWMSFYSADDIDRMVATQFQHTWRAGLRRGHHFAHSWPGGLYPSAVLGGRHLLELGILEIPVGPPFSTEQAASHVQLWATLGIDGLMTTGSQLQIYDEAATSVGIDLPALLSRATLMFVEASCQFAEPRKRVEDAYGVRLHNIGGAGEVPGLVASDCRFHTGLHVPPLGYVLQVCDPTTGREVPAGERGTLVVSTWGLDAFYLRYDLEDIAVASAGPCPCGQSGPRYTLIGRMADAAVIGDRTILPLDVQLALRDFGAPEFVLAAGLGDVLRLRVETTGTGRDEAAAVIAALDAPTEVDPAPVGTLPRSTFKPRRVISA